MRDPITKLSIVDPATVDKDIVKNFARYFTTPGRLSLIHYIGKVTRKTKLMTEKRVLIVSNTCVYMCHEDNSKRRCIKIPSITEAILTSDGFILLKIPTEYDSCFKLQNVAETEYLLNVLNITRSFTANDGLPLKHRSLGSISQVSSLVNYTKPNNYVNEMIEIPTLHELDQRQMAIDAFLQPPPPPISRSGGDRPVVGEKNLTNEAATILQHPLFDGSLRVPPPRPLHLHGAAAGESSVAGNNTTNNGLDQAGITRLQQAAQALNEQQESQLEIARRMKIQEANMTQQQAKQHHNTASGSSVIDHHSQVPMDLQAALSPLHQGGTSPSGNANANTAGSRQGSPSGTEQALQARVAMLEEELLTLRENQEHNRAEAMRVNQQEQQRLSPSVHAVPSSGGLHPQAGSHPLLSGVPLSSLGPSEAFANRGNHQMASSQHAVGQYSVSPTRPGGPLHSSPPRVSVPEFEASLNGKVVDERIVLRQYQIDDRKRKIDLLLKRSDSSIEVFELQEEMLELVAKMDEDMARAARDDPSALTKHQTQQHVPSQGQVQHFPPPTRGQAGESGGVNPGDFMQWMSAVTSAIAQHQAAPAQAVNSAAVTTDATGHRPTDESPPRSRRDARRTAKPDGSENNKKVVSRSKTPVKTASRPMAGGSRSREWR